MFILTNKFEKLMKLLKLDKPLLIFDVETTGQSISSDRIVQLAYIKTRNDGKTKKENLLFNPETRIPPESTAIHGIRNKHVENSPLFREKAQELWDDFNDCYYGGFNIADFDLPLLRREFIRVGIDFDYDAERIVDIKDIFEYMAPPTISLAYEYYCGKPYKGEHNASSHAEVSAEILVKQLEKYKEACDWDFIKHIHAAKGEEEKTSARKFYWLNGEAYFSFSKYKNRPLKQVVKQDKEFLTWVLEADFSESTKNIIRMALESKKK